jgi:hypothetical protein
MAADHHNHDAPAMDYAEHEKTFALFASIIKWGTVASLGLVLLTGAFSGTIGWWFALLVLVLLAGIAAKFF